MSSLNSSNGRGPHPFIPEIPMDAILFLLVVLVPIIGVVELLKWRRRHIARRLENDARRVREREIDELRQKRDHQLNHGRQIYNWLVDELKGYADVGIKVSRIEDNGGAFSIQIVREHVATMRGYDDILQISYNFVKYQAPYLGHIHYGAYGASILFWVGDHAPKEGLHRLVIQEVDREVARLRQPVI